MAEEVTLSDTLSYRQLVLGEPDDFSPVEFHANPDFMMAGRDFIIDESMYAVVSDEHCNALPDAGLVGFEADPVRGYRA